MAEPNDIERAAKNARHAAQLALLCVIVATVVLLIDNSIKRAILKARDQALTALADLGTMTGQVINERAEAAGVADSPGGAADPGGEPGERVGDAAAGREAVAPVAVVAGDGPPAGRAGGAGGPRGHG